MVKVAVAFHSGYGHTKAQAEAVVRGAASVQGASAFLVPVGEAEAHAKELDQADAIIFGAPTYMGSASAAFKGFMEVTSKGWMARAWQDKLAAGFTNSASQNGDKQNTLVELATFAMQHGMIWVGLGLLPGNNHSKGSLDDLNRLGGSLGALAQSNADQGIEGMQASDLKTAEHLGARVAKLAVTLAATRQLAA